MEALFAIFGVFFVIALTGIFRGFVIYKLWEWFLVPLGCHPITIPIALGISLLVSMFTATVPKEDDKSPDFGKVLATSIIQCLLSLGLGWIYTLFM